MIKDIILGNLKRTLYILNHYSFYKKNQLEGITLSYSQTCLDILVGSLCFMPFCENQDYELIDKSGNAICIAVAQTVLEMKSCSGAIGEKLYPVIAKQYLNANGPTLSMKNLQKRLNRVEIEMGLEEIQRYLNQGERMMTGLLFNNKILFASFLAATNNVENLIEI